MNAENFAEWYRRQGHHVIQTQSSYWYDAVPRVYQAFPFDWLIEPTELELRQMMKKYKILCIRYSTPIEAPLGKISYQVNLVNPYNLEILRSQARNAVRRGLSACKIESVSFERVAKEGWKLQRDTLDRQGRLSSMTEADWNRICRSAVGLDGFEAWAAIVGGEMAAALIIGRIGDTFYIPYAFSHRKYFKMHVNNALFYSVSSNLLSREGINSIFFTVQSLDAPKTVDEFKFRMGINAKAIRQRVTFHPILEPLVTKSLHRLILNASQRYPERASLAKVEGMVRFCLCGKLPLKQQEWPECLARVKQDIES